MWPFSLINKPKGVNLFGYYHYSFGLAQNLHSCIRLLERAGIPYTVSPIEASAHMVDLHPPKPSFNSDFPISIFFVNPDNYEVLLATYPELVRSGQQYRIAYWVYETSQLTNQFREYVYYVDELWTPSHFSAQLLNELGKPVSVIPMLGNTADPVPGFMPVSIREIVAAHHKKFLFIFDYCSCPFRKNISDTIDLFLNIWNQGYSFVFVIKIKNAPEAVVSSLRAKIGDAPITIITDSFSDRELAALYRCFDYYVSLHASEGYGLTILEAIAAGVMPIVTQYGGVTDFCDSTNAILIPYTLVSIPDESVYRGQGLWAKPNMTIAEQKIIECITRKEVIKPNQSVLKELSERKLAHNLQKLLQRATRLIKK